MATMNSGLGGPAGYGENAFTSTSKYSGDNDDGSVQIDVTSVFSGGITFLGSTYTEIYVNSNGLISFGTAHDAYSGGNIAGVNVPALLPFWTDYDLSSGGEIYWDFDTTNGSITITWNSVQEFGGGSANSHQVVLTDTGGGDFDVEFIYEDVSFAHDAIAGFTDGAGTHYELEGSGNDTFMLGYETNDFDAGDPGGTFTFDVEGGLPDVLTVEGTTGADTITLGYVDADGSEVTGGDDLIDGLAGADSIDGAGGDDTIEGGAGDDTITGGASGGTVDWTSVSAGDNVIGTVGQDFFQFTGGAGTYATVRFNNSAGPGDGDGTADYLHMDTTAHGISITVGDFDVGTDNIVLNETYASVSSTVHSATNVTFTITYTGGNQQSFDIYHAGGSITAGDVFTTTLPTAAGGDDSLSGGAGNDVLDGGDGDDSIDGGSGADSVYGDWGNDTIFGGTDNDTIDGFDGDDSIDGGDGEDLIWGGYGNDTYDGGAGTDTYQIDGSSVDGISFDVNLTTGFDQWNTLYRIENVEAGSGHDTLTGNTGNNLLSGNSGNDSIVGVSGSNTLSGGSGADSITGGTGDDTMSGGDDADTFIIENGFGDDIITGGEGGTDDDTIDLSALSSPVTVTYTGDEAGTITDGTDTITFSQIEQIIGTDEDDDFQYASETAPRTISAGTGEDTVNGGAGDDSLDAGGGADYVSGGHGHDTISGDDGADTLLGGYGDDSISGGIGDDSILSSFGDDTIHGGDGDDYIHAGYGDDSITGGAGNDTLDGGRDNDTLDGGDDADLFTFETFSMGNATIIGGEGGADTDTIDLNNLSTSVTVTYTGDEAGTITDGTHTITFSQIEQIIGTDEDDVFHAGTSSVGAYLDGGGGNDSIAGSLGDDTLITGDGADTLNGGAGNDSLVSNNTAGGGYANLIGGAGADTLDGTIGNYDIASYTASSAGVNIDLSDGSAEAGGDAQGDQLIGIEQIDASDHNDTIQLDDSGMQVYGRSGEDQLSGGSGNDTLDGGAEDDTLNGGAGDDRLTGGTGDDLLTGGAGDDTFVHTLGDGHDTITDFNTGNTGTLSDGDNTNNDFIDLTAYYDNLQELYADQADDGVLNQSNTLDSFGHAVDYSDNDQFGAGNSLTIQGASADSASFTKENTGLTCFTNGTRIRTPRGDVAVEDLVVGDLVCTAGQGDQPVLWIGHTDVSKGAQRKERRLRPIVIPAAPFGARRDLVVSQQHCLAGEVLDLRLSGHLVPAVHLLLMMKGVTRAPPMAGLRYFHILLPRHALVFSNDVPSESYYPGHQALKMLPRTARARLDAVLPALAEQAPTDAYGPRLAPRMGKSAMIKALGGGFAQQSRSKAALARPLTHSNSGSCVLQAATCASRFSHSGAEGRP